jgi:hypothetical protein
VSPSQTPPSKRKRGAQPANTNALKHGFYSRVYQTAEASDLDTILHEGLQDEIEMLRVITRRVLTLAEGSQDIETMSNLLGTLGLSATRLASLLKTQRLLSTGDQDTAHAISEALSQVVRELGIRV